jgi:glycosyltransferase involved in cell wall biosynthesis
MQTSARHKESSPPVIVTGMHRSGTSLVASFLEALGVDLGGEMVPPDANNPRGYREDVEFLKLSRQMVARATREGDGGHRDWGWTESEHFDLDGCELGAAASALMARRRQKDVPWGWKDPRSTLLLDFWDRIAGGDARFVFVYRYPWDVADSMQRLGAEVFLDNPGYAYRIWSFYNRRLLDFYRRHESRAVLASVNAVVREPERFVALLRDKLGLNVVPTPLDELYDGDQHFSTIEGADPLIDLVGAAFPRSVDLLRELDQAADVPSSRRWRAGAARTGIAAPGDGDEVALSIVVPCCDHGEVLIEALASVERGAPRSCELLIVNDGSRQPRTLEILAALRQAGYRIIDQENQGLAAARNRGIQAAVGRYIFPLDSDNRVRPGFLDKAIAILDDRREIGVVFGDRWQFGLENGRLEVPDLDLEKLLWRNTLDACAVYRKSLWADVGGYDTVLRAWEDWELWIHAAIRRWRFHHLGEIAFDYRVRPRSLASLLDDREIQEDTVGHIVSKYREVYRKRLHETIGVIEAWPSWLERQRDQYWLRKCALEEQIAHLAAEKGRLTAATERLDRELAEVVEDRDRLWREKCQVEDGYSRLWGQKCELEAAVSRSNDLLDRRQHEIAGLRSQLAARNGKARRLAGKIAAMLKWGT